MVDLNSNVRAEFAIVVLSCDAYSDLWPIYFSQFKKYWGRAEDSVYLVCNEKHGGIEGVQDACSGPDIDWSTSLRASLDKVKEDNVLLFIDDAFFCEPVNQDLLEQYYRDFLEKKMNYLRLKNSPFPDTKINKYYGQISPGQLYRTAIFPSIWKKDILLSVLKDGESAWQFELQGSDRSDSLDGFYGVYNDMFKVIHGVIKGKWDPSAISALQKEGISSFIGRSVLSHNEVLGLRFAALRKYGLRLFPGRVRKAVRRFIYKIILRKEWFS